MSYSFSVTAKSKDEAKTLLTMKFMEIVANQPAHAADRDAALSTASAFIDLLKDVPEDHEVQVSMHGALGWSSDSPDQYTGTGVGVSASIQRIV